ncbi:MAG: Zn-ribbon domain-containing OB-fold protein [Candidatus Aminicenantaceae bacterium]
MLTPQRYWREIPHRYRLEAGRCKKCGYVAFPPRLVCPRCKNREFESVKLKDEGEIVSYTIIRVPPEQFTDQAPYVIGIIELDSEVKILAQIVDCDFDDLAIGKKAKIELRKIRTEGESGIICYGYKGILLE